MSKTTEIICILDRSGSMAHLATEVINSFNHFIEEQQALPDKAKVTLVLFDDQYEIVHDRIKLADMPKLTESTYFTRGMTAMNDAIGKTLMNVDNKRDKAIVLIQTDGYENASQEYAATAIKKMVKEKEDKGWKFIFLGANIDAAHEGGRLGININNTVQYDPSNAGVKRSYDTMSVATMSYRVGDPVTSILDTTEELDIDTKKTEELIKGVKV